MTGIDDLRFFASALAIQDVTVAAHSTTATVFE